MNYSTALIKVVAGQLVRRSGWNGKGMYLFLISQWTYTHPRADDALPRLPFIAMKTADNKVVPWLCSQTDALAEDWEFAGE